MSSKRKGALQKFVDWLKDEMHGSCSTEQVCKFYERNRDVTKHDLGSLKSLCKQNKKMLIYHRKDTANHIICSISLIGCEFVQSAVFEPMPDKWSQTATISQEAIDHVLECTVDVNRDVPATNTLLYYLLREKKKKISKDNRDELKKDTVKIQTMLTSNNTLKEMADEEKITTTDLAIVLLGWAFIDECSEVNHMFISLYYLYLLTKSECLFAVA